MRGLLGPVPRKNGWQLAAQAGETNPDGMQRLLTSARWDADAVRDDLRQLVIESFGDPDGILTIADQEFVKKGNRSVGVERQYARTTGHFENCQVGVFLAYTGRHTQAILDRELYLPESWARNPARRQRAGVPTRVPFRSRPELALAMLDRAVAAGTPMSWVGAAEPYGSDPDLCAALEDRQLSYVLGVGPDERLRVVLDGRPATVRAGSLPSMVPGKLWHRIIAREPGDPRGTAPSWARVPMPSPRFDPNVAHWLLLRKGLVGHRGLRYYVCRAERSASLGDLVEVARAVEHTPRVLTRACDEAGLATYEVRRWTAWYRHATLASLAYLALVLSKKVPPRPNTHHLVAVSGGQAGYARHAYGRMRRGPLA